MALPKKRKFLRYAISKLKALHSAYKRRTAAFSKGQSFKVSNGFFTKIESGVTSCLFSRVTPTLELIRAHAVSFLAFNRFSLLSTFYYRSDLSLAFKHRLFVFGECAVYSVLSLYSLRCELSPKLSKETQGGLRFALDGVSGFLYFTPVSIPTPTSTTKAPLRSNRVLAKSHVQSKAMLAPEFFFFNKKDSLDKKVFKQKMAYLKQTGGAGSVATPQELGVKAQTKTSLFFNYVGQKLEALVKTNYGAVSWVTWFLDLFKGMSSASNIKAELGTSVDLFNNFFINTKFYKKIQWKTNFKYYYWTNDALWMRYRYRIYWYKKAIYLRLNSLVFMYYYSRLRSVQKRAKETLSTWHNLRSKQYQAIQTKLALSAEPYADKFANTLLFSRILRLLSRKSVGALSRVCASPLETRTGTFISTKLSLPLRRVIFFGIDTQLYAGKTYSRFLYRVDPVVRVLNQVGDATAHSTPKGGVFIKFLRKLTKQKKKKAGTCITKVARWKKQLRLKSRLSLIFLRRRG